MTDFSPSNFESFSLKSWVIYHLIQSSRCCCWYHVFLLNPLKVDGIASSHSALHHTMCIISYSLTHKCSYNLEQECKYLMQSWMYHVQPCCHQLLCWPSLDCCLFEVYHTLRSLIHLVHLMLYWLSNSILFVALTLVDSITPKSYFCMLTVNAHGPLGHLVLTVIIPCRGSKPITRLVNFRLAS
jgi:hypothetical protein